MQYIGNDGTVEEPQPFDEHFMRHEVSHFIQAANAGQGVK